MAELEAAANAAEEVASSLEQIEESVERWAAIKKAGDERLDIKLARDEVVSGLKTLEWDVKDLDAAIKAAPGASDDDEQLPQSLQQYATLLEQSKRRMLAIRIEVDAEASAEAAQLEKKLVRGDEQEQEQSKLEDELPDQSIYRASAFCPPCLKYIEQLFSLRKSMGRAMERTPW